MDEIIKTMEMELIDPPGEIPVVRPIQEFHIQTKEQAEWVVSKFNAVEAKKNLIKEQAAAMIREAEAQERYLEWRFSGELKAWASKNLPERKKSLRLLTGTLSFRTTPEKLEVKDEVVCMAWAQESCPEAWRIKEVQSIDKTALKEHWKKTGEIPPGCDVVPEGESFTIS